MKILAMAASNSSKSINHRLIQHAATLLRDGLIANTEVEVDVLNLNDFEMPLYSTDREEAGGVPEPGSRFYNLIGDADGLVFSFAEHNGSYSAAFKNLYDWTSRVDMKVYQGKPMVLLATSPGGRGGAGVLQTATAAAPHFGADVRASLSIPSFYEKFDMETGELSNDETLAELRAALQTLAPS